MPLILCFFSTFSVGILETRLEFFKNSYQNFESNHTVHKSKCWYRKHDKIASDFLSHQQAYSKFCISKQYYLRRLCRNCIMSMQIVVIILLSDSI